MARRKGQIGTTHVNLVNVCGQDVINGQSREAGATKTYTQKRQRRVITTSNLSTGRFKDFAGSANLYKKPIECASENKATRLLRTSEPHE